MVNRDLGYLVKHKQNVCWVCPSWNLSQGTFWDPQEAEPVCLCADGSEEVWNTSHHSPHPPPQFQKRACVVDGVIAWWGREPVYVSDGGRHSLASLCLPV